MAKDLMRYDKLVEGALRGVMVEALRRVAGGGLPGNHHFYVSFRTDHPGVRVSADLLAQYPEEMTIVLQHQFWDLAVDDAGFSVGLSFGGRREHLTVPFEAVTGFADPSVNFGLQFEPGESAADAAPVETLKTPEKPAAKEAATPKSGDAGEVVALDAFRKK